MKKLLLLIFIIFLYKSAVLGQAVQWASLQDICPPTFWGGPQVPYIASDGDNLISIGSISGSITFGNQVMTSKSSGSCYLAKHDKDGNLLWAKHLVGATYGKVSIDGNDDIVVAGSYLDSLVIGSFLFTHRNQGVGLFIAKFNSSGNLIWARSSNPGSTSFNIDLTTDGSGNIYVAGETYYYLGFDTISITQLGFEDIYLIKYDAAGNFQWLNNAGTVGRDQNVSLIGGRKNTVYIAYNSNTTSNTTQPGPNGYILKKFDNTGAQVWSKLVNKRYVYNRTYLSRDSDENIYLAGKLDTTLVFDSYSVVPNSSVGNSFIAKITPSGNWRWGKTIPVIDSAGQLLSMASQAKDELNIIKAGHYQNTVSFQLIKLDTSGAIVKVNKFYKPVPNQTKLLHIGYSTTDDPGNTYFSGVAAGPNTLGTFVLNAPPAITSSVPSSPSAAFIAKILDSPNTISGTLFIDTNGNGVRDSTELPFENGILEINPGPGYTSSAANGAYLVDLTAGTFNLGVVQPALHYILPQSYSTTFATIGQNQTQDFALTPIPNRNDVKVSVTNLTPARPGFSLRYRLTFENVGTITLSDSLTLTFDAGYLTFVTAGTAPTLQHTGKLKWYYQTLQPNQKRNIDIDFNIAATTPLGTNLQAIATIKPVAIDYYPANNYDTLNHEVTGAYDPNDKQVSLAKLTPVQVTNGQLLDYTIRFQNTGTDTAFTVIVRDSISENLVMPTFELLSASHPFTFKFLHNGMAEWRFENILLPDSNRNEAGSHGFIRYRIQPKTTLHVGDEIKTRAGIYFDYNSPIMTNKAITRIVYPAIAKGELTLYPNPATETVEIAASLASASAGEIRIFDTLGKLVYQQKVSAEKEFHQTVSVRNLTRGVYVVQVVAGKVSLAKRLVVL